MSTETASTSDATNELPPYAEQLAAFHRAFEPELKAIVDSLPLSPAMQMLDVGCGDGFYLGLFAQRLAHPGGVTGLDINEAFLHLARQQPALRSARCETTLICGDLDDLATLNTTFDLVWCAQSLYSLPEPVAALRQMGQTLKPGGLLAVLENDSLHQLLLPWPSHLELAFRAAELASFCSETDHSSKFYVGRRLPSIFAAAGLEPLGFRTQCIDRQAPLDDDLELFLRSYLERLQQRVQPHLPPTYWQEFAALVDPEEDNYLLHQPYFTMSWLNVLVWGRTPTSNR